MKFDLFQPAKNIKLLKAYQNPWHKIHDQRVQVQIGGLSTLAPSRRHVVVDKGVDWGYVLLT